MLYDMQLNKIIKLFYPTRVKESTLSIIIYFVLLFGLDYSGVMDLYGQNFVRRCINMYRRRDYETYKKKLKPFCKEVKEIISKDDLQKLQQIKIPKDNDVPWFSRKNTTTHQYGDKYSKEEKEIIDQLSEKIRVKYEKIINKPLYNLESNIPTIYVYHGKDSQHLWHVDPQNLSEIHNIIICIKKVGNISPLQYKDSQGNEHSVFFEEGDAAIFNGGTTVHQVPPNEDDNSERTVLSIAYTSDKNLNKKGISGNNLCTYIQGGNNYLNMFKIIFSVFVINLIFSYISGTKDIPYNYLFVYALIVLFTVSLIPSLNLGIGSGRSSSIHHNIVLILLFTLFTLSPKGGVIFFSYFALSDVFFPSSWVSYD